MAPLLPSFTLLLITSFHSGHTDIVPLDSMTETTCKKEAEEKRNGWKFYGDRTVFKSLSYVCLENKQ